MSCGWATCWLKGEGLFIVRQKRGKGNRGHRSADIQILKFLSLLLPHRSITSAAVGPSQRPYSPSVFGQSSLFHLSLEYNLE